MQSKVVDEDMHQNTFPSDHTNLQSTTVSHPLCHLPFIIWITRQSAFSLYLYYLNLRIPWWVVEVVLAAAAAAARGMKRYIHSFFWLSPPTQQQQQLLLLLPSFLTRSSFRCTSMYYSFIHSLYFFFTLPNQYIYCIHSLYFVNKWRTDSIRFITKSSRQDPVK